MWALILPTAAHAAIPFFDPIVPTAINLCPASWAMLIDVINNIISFGITIAIVFVAPLMIGYAGFLYVVNPVDPGGIKKAKGILLNTVVGIVIALCGWLIVDAVMAVLYHPTDSTLGTWSSLITSGGLPVCLTQAGSLGTLNQGSGFVGGGYVTGVNPGGSAVYINGQSGALCSDSNTACSPAFLQSVGFTPAQANTMSCIAITESSGDPSSQNPEGACGTFQILPGNWVTPSLHSGNCSSATSCTDPYCNAQTAYKLGLGRLANGESRYKDWTCDGCNAKAQSCVNRYDPGH